MPALVRPCAKPSDRGIGLEPLHDAFGQGGTAKIARQEQTQQEGAPVARRLGWFQLSPPIDPLMDAEKFQKRCGDPGLLTFQC